MKIFFASFIIASLALAARSDVVLAALPGCPPDAGGCEGGASDGSNEPADEPAQEPESGTGPDQPSTPSEGESGLSDSGQPAGDAPADSAEPGALNELAEDETLDPAATDGDESTVAGVGPGGGLAAGQDFAYPGAIPADPEIDQCELIIKGENAFSGDLDDDGLFAGQESAHATDEFDPDTDYDSYFDGQEVCAGFDPLEPPVIAPVDHALVTRLLGQILLQVEDRGKAWYLYPPDRLRYYLRNGNVAYGIMRFLSLGITDANLAKIPVGVEPRFAEPDADGDGLSDKMEEGLKTDPVQPDTDGDGAGDGDEVLKHATDPKGAGSLPYDASLAARLRGRILLQVESRGEAWYLNPSDNKRYYLRDGEAAYQIMRFLSLGITNSNIMKIPIGPLRGRIK